MDGAWRVSRHAGRESRLYPKRDQLTNIVARSLELGPGDEVLTTDHEHGAMDRTWRFLSKERGFRYINQQIEMPITTDENFIEAS